MSIAFIYNKNKRSISEGMIILINYLDMWKHSKIVTPELLPKYQIIIYTQQKNHSAKLNKEQKSLIKQSLHESIFKNKVINIALLDPFDDSYISGVVVQLNDKDITLRNNSDCIKIPLHLIIGIL